MWGFVGLAVLYNSKPTKTVKKRKVKAKKKKSPKIHCTVFVDTLRKFCGNKVIFSPVAPSLWPILSKKMAESQIDTEDVMVLGKYLKSNTDWLKEPFHLSQIVMKLEMWQAKAQTWQKKQQASFEFKPSEMAGRRR